LVRLGRIVWSELPLMAAINLLLGLGGAAVAATAVSVVLLAPLVAAFLLGPVWLGAVATCDRLLAGETPGIGDFFAEVRRRARTGIALAVVPAVVATVLLGSLALLHAADGARWMLIPIAVDVLVLAILGCGCITVFPLAVATELRGRERWIVGLALAGRRLTATLGIAAAVILLALAARYAGPFFALVALAPLCLLTTATVRSVASEAGR
jgi:hypothetical protein